MERFGKYQLMERLAVGGMAEIFLARATGVSGFSKFVAIKRIHAQWCENEDFVSMLIDEAKISSSLDHPNIVHVFDLGKVGRRYYIAMELVEGRDLRTVVARAQKTARRIDVAHVLQIGARAAAGLSYAHERKDAHGQPLGIVHRDISPHNVLISFRGNVKVADFGIARAEGKITETRTGVVKGKFGYMSVEQSLGEKLDRRSDIYSLGIVLHELVTGKRLYQADSDVQVLRKIQTEDVPTFESLGLDVPEGLDAIVQKALARDREARYADAAELQRNLTKLLHQVSPGYTDQDLGELMESLFHDDRVRLQQRLAAWAKRAGPDGGEVPPPIPGERGSEEDPIDLGSGSISLIHDPSAGHAVSFEDATHADAQSEASYPSLPSQPPALHHAPPPAAAPPQSKPSRGLGVGLGLVGIGAIAAVAFLVGRGQVEPAATKPAEPPPVIEKAPEVGGLLIETQPSGASISVDGKPLPDKSPAVATGLRADQPHELTVELEGYETVKRPAVVEAGRVAKLLVELSPRMHALSVITEPPGATLQLDGVAAGKSPATVEVSALGEHRLSVKLAGHRSVTRPLSAEILEAGELSLTLEKRVARYGTVDIKSFPWARVWVDGRDTGENTPVKGLRLRTGSHSIKLVQGGAGSAKTFKVHIKEGTNAPLVHRF